MSTHCVYTCVSVCVNVLFTLLGEVTSHWFSRNAQRGMNSLSGHTEAHTPRDGERRYSPQHSTHSLWHWPGKTNKKCFPKKFFMLFVYFSPHLAPFSAQSFALSSSTKPGNQTGLRLTQISHCERCVLFSNQMLVSCVFPWLMWIFECVFINTVQITFIHVCCTQKLCLFCDSQLLTFYLVKLHIQNYWINVKLCIVFLFTLIEGVLQWISMLCGLQEKLKLQRLRYLDF